MKSIFILALLLTLGNSFPINDCQNQTIEVNNNTCHDCEAVVNVIIHEVKFANKTINEIIKVVESICNLTSPIIKNECEFILKNIKNIINWATHGFNSTQICQKLNFCKSLDNFVPLSHNITCDVCHTITTIVIKEIKLGNNTFNGIVNLVKEICDIFGQPIISQECDFYIDQLKHIEHWIVEGLTWKEICQKLGLCNTTYLTS